MIKITAGYLRSQGLSPTFETRFWSKVKKSNGCWIWIGGSTSYGYGYIGALTDTMISAHRASWILNFGPIPKGLNVLHRCPVKDNPKCVNPSHLYLGTQRDNNLDAIKNGRKYLYGPAVYNSKLTWRQVATIRKKHLNGATQVSLARKFSVSTTTINWIVRGWSYKIKS